MMRRMILNIRFKGKKKKVPGWISVDSALINDIDRVLFSPVDREELRKDKAVEVPFDEVEELIAELLRERNFPVRNAYRLHNDLPTPKGWLLMRYLFRTRKRLKRVLLVSDQVFVMRASASVLKKLIRLHQSLYRSQRFLFPNVLCSQTLRDFF